MVSSVLFFQVNQRLTEIFRYSGKEPFAGLPVIVCRDLYRLPPVKGLPVYSSATSMKGFLALDLWKKFQMVELTEVMRQRGDHDFIRVLNKIREGNISEEVEHTLQARVLETKSYPEHAMHMFAENKPVKRHDETQLNNLDSQLVCIEAINKFPKNINVPHSQIDAIKLRKINETGNLESQLNFKVGSQVMITSNIDTNDRLVNGLVGKVSQFKYSNIVVSVVFDSAELEAMRSDVTARQYHLVPIKKREALFGLRKKSQQPSVKKTQFSLTLSWACTVHKVQGLSLTEGVASFDLESQKSFNQGQMYVTLSRITNINELYLIGKYNKAALKVNESTKREYERLRTEICFESQTQNRVTKSAITISLLNTRSFKTHFRDILMEKQLLDNGILCLTETH